MTRGPTDFGPGPWGLIGLGLTDRELIGLGLLGRGVRGAGLLGVGGRR